MMKTLVLDMRDLTLPEIDAVSGSEGCTLPRDDASYENDDKSISTLIADLLDLTKLLPAY